MSAFLEFPKIGRLCRDMVVTEKIDGTNAQIQILNIASSVSTADSRAWIDTHAIAVDGDLVMLAGSRSKYLTLGKDGAKDGDNFGFAKWVRENAAELWKLGEGRHFGEWWGLGIQRGYGQTVKRLSLFNTHKWSDAAVRPACCEIVPVLARWTFDTAKVDMALESLRVLGSAAAPGFMNPEGVVVFHSATGTLFKKTIEKDAEPKGQGAKLSAAGALTQ